MFPSAHGIVSQVVAGQSSGGGGGESVEFIAHTNDTHSGGTTTETLVVPEGAQAGDLLIAAIAANAAIGSGISDLDGWTLLHTASLGGSFGRETFLGYIVIAGTPPVSYTWTFGGSTNRAWAVACFRGQNADTPILDHDWNQTATPPELMAVDGCAAFGAWRDTSGGPSAPAEMTAIVTAYGAGSNVDLTAAYEIGLTAGAYTRTASHGDGVSASMVLIQP